MTIDKQLARIAQMIDLKIEEENSKFSISQQSFNDGAHIGNHIKLRVEYIQDGEITYCETLLSVVSPVELWTNTIPMLPHKMKTEVTFVEETKLELTKCWFLLMSLGIETNAVLDYDACPFDIVYRSIQKGGNDN